ncbi:MAG: FAA hydrolase family protein [Actinomycetota bacterium]|nr:MAG: FAA hydrolase family protein [Actinomycetota bacterium]
MRLATVRIDGGTTAVRLEDQAAVRLPAVDVGAVLDRPDWRDWAASTDGERLPIDGLDYAPLILRPGKIICVGLNYRTHILESGQEIPEVPMFFAKYPEALVGANDDILLPPESTRVDWEAELAIVIGAAGRRIPAADAYSHIAGYAVMNDISMRDWQLRSSQWTPGKTFEASAPFGPWLLTDSEQERGGRTLTCEVAGERMQTADTADLVFGPADLVEFVSTVMTLRPGDVIASGTPGGVGGARNPKRYLRAGETVVTAIDGLGECRNVCVAEQVPGSPLVNAVPAAG